MSNEEKILELLQGIRGDVANLDRKVSALEEDVFGLKKESQLFKDAVTKIVTRYDNSLKVLFDAYSNNADNIKQYEQRIRKLEWDVEKLNIEMRFLKSSYFSTPITPSL